MHWTTLLTAGWAGTVAALAVPSSHVVHEAVGSAPPRWIKRGRVSADAILPVRIGLAQSNLDKAHDYLMDVSDPDSPNYGKFWTSDQVIEKFQPSDESVRRVRSWLVDAGIQDETITHSENKAWLAFPASSKQMETLLHAEYYEFEDQKTGGIMPATERYHVPKELQAHIDYLTPGVKLLAPNDTPVQNGNRQQSKRGQSQTSSSLETVPSGEAKGFAGPLTHRPSPYPPGYGGGGLSTCDEVITPACIAKLYDIPQNENSHPNPSNAMGIYEAELQFWDQLDLDLFFTNFTRWIPNGTHPTARDIDGGVAKTSNPADAGGEAMLDLSNSYPIVYPQEIVIFNDDDLVYQAWPNQTYTWGFNTWLDAIDGSYCTFSAYNETGDAPGIDPTYPDPAPGGYKGKLQCGVYRTTNVVSLSYGGQEANVPIAYQKRQCMEYLKLGLHGVSVVFASGDSGVGDYPAPYGFSGPTGCLGPKGAIFNPFWPANCPYTTAVGATKVYPGHSVFEPQPESAVYDPAGHPYAVNFSSGGGFSNVYPIPSYQKNAVATYFAERNPPYKYYSGLVPNANNPALPDVAALAGKSGGIYNRIGRGYPDLAANGDNIAVYVNGSFGLSGGTSSATPIVGSILNRINEERLAAGKSSVGFVNPTLYKNPQMLNDITNGSNPDCNTIGFETAKGWDPVSGLGTPNFEKMLQVFMSLP